MLRRPEGGRAPAPTGVIEHRRGLRVPLAETVAAVDAVNPWLEVRLGWPEDRTGWTACNRVDRGFIAVWEEQIAAYLRRAYGHSHPMTVVGFTLDWYAKILGVVGGACFRISRRVPHLGPDLLAFSRHQLDSQPDAVALLDVRFWCLPDDPDADHPDARVADDERALAAVLREQVRTHANAFLAAYGWTRRLPRRLRLGAFSDALETGIWYAGDTGPGAAEEVVRLGALALPGRTREFAAASSLYRLTDLRGRTHLSRRRAGCCHAFLVDDGQACLTCARVGDDGRAARYSQPN